VDERSAWIALASVDGIGEETFGKLIADFGSAAAALEAAGGGRLDRWIAERRKHDGRVPVFGRSLVNLRATANDASVVFEEAADRELWMLTPLDTDYPARLRDLDPPPATVFGRGKKQAMDAKHAVAIVGTRTPTIAGRSLVTRIARRLVEHGVVVVSGLAVGIDGAAHAATVEAGGTTVAVIGAGHDTPGPRAHTGLRREIVDSGGAVISEYRPTSTARKGTFPRRNRIIAALGDATIVVDAPAKSGALITASKALELSRTVLVAPGRVGDWATAGSLKLLRETPAQALVGLDEMVEDLDLLDEAIAADDAVPAANLTKKQLLAVLGPTEAKVAMRLLDGPAGLDALVADTNLPPAVVSSAVTLLLLRGWVQSVGPAYTTAGALAR
jgi:DNA processing protein